jgi:exosortase/archaeosortase family protein
VTTRQWMPKTAFKINWQFFNLDVLFFVFFSVPVLLLYIFAPSTFQITWKGRVPYVIFIWLTLLEISLSRRKLQKPTVLAELNQSSVRFFLGLVALFVPTAFTVWQFMIGGRDPIIFWGRLLGAPFPESELDWPIAFESLLFALFFMLSVWLLQNLDGLKRFKVSLFFIGAVATFFMMDTFYHWGTVWFLQLFVPAIASIVAFFLNMLGYTTIITVYADGYLLAIRKMGCYAVNLLVYWPCAGVHSLIIYTFVILLLFSNLQISSKRKIIYSVVGAFGTFIANILRIVSIGAIGANTGPEASRLFHEYYGELFFVVWIVAYLIVVTLCESCRKAS